MIRYAALGDSVTLGLGDPLPDGSWRGWATILAEALAACDEVKLCNLARSGALVCDVAAEQLPRAVDESPSLATVLVGVNDTLRGRFELTAIAADLDGILAELRRSGALVLTASLPDPGLMLGIPGMLRRPLARRIHAINMVLAHLGRRHGTIHLDLAADPELYDRRHWAVDRLHPSERGHRYLAWLFATLLVSGGVMDARALPGLDPTSADPSAWSQAWWLATKGVAWLARRSRDLLPRLIRLIIVEAWHYLRGTTARLDAALNAQLAAVLEHHSPASPTPPLSQGSNTSGAVGVP
jgi:lysophospholipase L1-like esterase